ncbi:MAG: DMT family protein [Pirellulales bacterium]
MLTILLLITSNVFMTLAWYGHVWLFEGKPKPVLWATILICWLVALQKCRALRSRPIARERRPSTSQLKIIQEVIAVAIFLVLNFLVGKQLPRWNEWGCVALIVGAVLLARLPAGGATDVGGRSKARGFSCTAANGSQRRQAAFRRVKLTPGKFFRFLGKIRVPLVVRPGSPVVRNSFPASDVFGMSPDVILAAVFAASSSATGAVPQAETGSGPDLVEELRSSPKRPVKTQVPRTEAAERATSEELLAQFLAGASSMASLEKLRGRPDVAAKTAAEAALAGIVTARLRLCWPCADHRTLGCRTDAEDAFRRPSWCSRGKQRSLRKASSLPMPEGLPRWRPASPPLSGGVNLPGERCDDRAGHARQIAHDYEQSLIDDENSTGFLRSIVSGVSLLPRREIAR